MAKHRLPHLYGIQHILQYLKGTLGQDIFSLRIHLCISMHTQMQIGVAALQP